MPPLETPNWMEEERKKFTAEEIIEELKDILYWAPDKVNFRFKTGTNLVEVYIWNSLNYVINRNFYLKLVSEDRAEKQNVSKKQKDDSCDYPFKDL